MQTNRAEGECGVQEQEEEKVKEKEEEEDEVDLLGTFLDESDGHDINNAEFAPIEKHLNEFRTTIRIPAKSNLFSYWESNKFNKPELYQLAIISQGMPMTQVSVERLFSGMKYIFSDLRGNLLPGLLDDILVIRSYFQFKK